MKETIMRIEVERSGKKPNYTPLVQYWADKVADLWANHPELEEEYQEWKRQREVKAAVQ